MDDKDLYSGLIRLHILHHAAYEPIFGLGIIEELGRHGFQQIGIPAPEILAPFVGVVEVGCGLLVLLGVMTRLAAMPLVVDMLVAIATTKVPILLKRGFWAMAHEARTDYAMLLGAIFLLLVGAGPVSIDARLARHERARDG
jgi:uncharacterized membrane protein YphA (DoxX/SURF4 family)